MESKTVSYSRLETRYRPQPAEANNNGVMHGGHILFHLDSAAGMTAIRHAGCKVTTAAVDRMDFLRSIYPGENIVIRTRMNMAGRSSMEIGAEVFAENAYSGEKVLAGRAFLVYVAIGDDGKSTPVPALLPETDEDRHVMAEAEARQVQRRTERSLRK